MRLVRLCSQKKVFHPLAGAAEGRQSAAAHNQLAGSTASRRGRLITTRISREHRRQLIALAHHNRERGVMDHCASYGAQAVLENDTAVLAGCEWPRASLGNTPEAKAGQRRTRAGRQAMYARAHWQRAPLSGFLAFPLDF
jgi:hypothetical protein